MTLRSLSFAAVFVLIAMLALTQSAYASPPTITITSPKNVTYAITSIDLNVAADETINTWWHSLDGETNVTFTPNITLTGLTDGHHNITVYANDIDGNVGIGNVQTVVEAWTRTYDGGNYDDPWDIAVDNSGNVYVTGQSYLTDSYDYATLKYDSAGNELWKRTYDGGSNEIARGVAVDDSGNVYVTGWSNLSGNWDYYTIKYNSAGNLLWNRTYDMGSRDDAQDIAVDSSENVYVTGGSGTIKYDSDGNLVWTVPSGGNEIAVDGLENVYVTGGSGTIKYDSDGNLVWTVPSDGKGLAVDGSGNVYVTGTSNLNGNYDYYTIKYDSSGNVLWSSTYDGGSRDSAYGVAVDSSENVYVTGTSNLSGNWDYYTIKYDSSGNAVWNTTYNVGSYDYAYGIAVDSSANVYVVGHSVIGNNYDYHIIKYSQTVGPIYFTVDTIPPSISGPSEIYVTLGSTKNIVWTITEANDGQYYVLRNGTVVTSASSYVSGLEVNQKIIAITRGSWNYTIIANDTGGNEAQDEVTVVVSAPPPITALATTDGDSPPSTRVEVNATVQDRKAAATLTSISKGSTGKISLSDSAGVPFTEIAIKVKNKVTNVHLTIYKLAEKPDDIAEDITGMTHSYIQIDESNIEAADVDRVMMTFKVPISWINDNNIDKATVVLNRYADDKWTALTSTKTSESSDYVYYSANSPGLSVFGISGQVQTTVTTTTTPPVTTTVPATVAPATTAPPPGPLVTTVPPAREAEKKGICGPTTVLLLAMLFPALSRIRRRSR